MIKNIIFFARDLNIGGNEKALVDLLNAIDKSQYKITLILENKKGELLKALEPHITVKEYKMSKCPVKILRRASNLFHRIFWGVVHYKKYSFSCSYATYSVIGSRLAVASSNNAALYIHSNYDEVFRHDKEKIKQFFGELKINDFQKIILVSSESKEAFDIIYPELNLKTTVIGNLIDYKKIMYLSQEKLPKRKPEEKVILFVGRLEEESKRLSRLLESFSIVVKQDNSYRLWIVGAGKDLCLCKKLILDYNLSENVSMLGRQENPYPYMKAADCVVLTSDFEGYPVVYNESLVLGKPLVTTIPTADEFIDIRNYAYVVEKDSSKIAAAIIKTTKQIGRDIIIDFEEINQKKLQLLYKVIG